MFGQPEHAGPSDAVVVWRVRPNPEVIVHVADSADRFRDSFGGAFGRPAVDESCQQNLALFNPALDSVASIHP